MNNQAITTALLNKEAFIESKIKSISIPSIKIKHGDIVSHINSPDVHMAVSAIFSKIESVGEQDDIIYCVWFEGTVKRSFFNRSDLQLISRD